MNSDTERLDWLTANQVRVMPYVPFQTDSWLWSIEVLTSGERFEGKDLRVVIDVAMADELVRDQAMLGDVRRLRRLPTPKSIPKSERLF